MTAPLRIIVTGTRDAVDPYPLVEEAFWRAWDEDKRLRDDPGYRELVVVHGNSGTVDRAGRHFAEKFVEMASPEPHPADWTKHGRAAGPIRNSEMAKAGADLCLAFWDGKSRGTLDMITKAVRHGIPVRIVPVEAAG